MKKITKIIASTVAVAALFISVNANAQSAPKFGIGLNVGAGTSAGTNLAIGGDIRYQFDLDKQLSVPVTAGYTNIGIKNSDLNIGFIPVKAGLKYFFNDSGAGAYGLAEAGAGFAVGDNTGTSFVYSPAIGYSWSNGLDLAAKYEGYSNNGNVGYAGIRLAYGFKL
ncbi:outer membrane beta-barrel protein [Pedobacter namyangjuensis]|uniref:outer membrane beta-barrel protein n=1 Tax=Pedobacter namyangjuensis TaxID=600626 RepID=UPI000DE3B7CE|nr:outer membrane beta-barrel protein [Pedobacter namyangjuensis]